MKFTDFNLHPDLQKGIDEAGYTNCMPVQQQVLSHAFGSHDAKPSQDLYVQSQTGTGKTAAFLIIIFQRMLTDDTLRNRKALIMAPTRELAVQIEEEAKMLGKHLPFKTGAFYGGVGYAQQEKLLRDNAQILVGTPGRVLDLNKTGKMNLMEISFLVLDEADRMFDMGFYPDLRKLIKVVPSSDKRQTLLFSATLNAYVKNLAWEYTKTPFEIEITPEVVTVEEITQILYHVPSQEKFQLLLGILKREQPESAIIFCNTKKHTEIIAKRLRHNGYKCEFIIGDLPQVKRLKIIDDVKNGKTKMLIATDVAARGLDIESLAMVINYDVPTEAENYVHRIGRTARAGKTGKAFTLSSEQDVYELPAIERYIGKKIPSEIAMQEHYEEDKSAGVRIHTDDYSRGDRKTQREDKGKNFSPKRKDRQDRQGKEKRFTRSHRDTEKKEFLPRTSRTNTNEEKKRGNNTFTSSSQRLRSSASGSSQTNDLSQLSMDERMAHYKKKYAGKPPVQSEKQKQPAPERIVQEQTAPKKQGILSKIKGLFGKK
ncbi:MAG: DEAD/DEAH box helicase [Treponema sp.]|nr:DEAD/DEAH box helicase [Treponema sp.]MCL2237714.1 DEAD/DEAH box helicase [Treponema sp.]